MELNSSEFNGSLFEGMTLFSSSSAVGLPPPSPSPPSPPPPLESPSQSQSQSQPLDEDLFSDLTLQAPAPSLSLSLSQSQSLITPPESPSRSSSRVLRQQVSRKKKRAVRIGYAREAISLDDEPHLPSSSFSSAPLPSLSASSASEAVTSTDAAPHDDSSADPNSIPAFSVQPESLPEMKQKEEAELESELACGTVINQDQDTHINKEEECPYPADNGDALDKGDALDLVTEKLSLIRDKISAKVESARQRAALVIAKRKELAAKRRNIRDEVNQASARYTKLEGELEEACENEDFERAERISDALASVERGKNQLLLDLKAAELDYDAVDSEMQDVLHLHLAAEEEAVFLLQHFAKDATDYADLVRKNTEEKACKELEEWEASMELLEMKKMEVDVERDLIVEAQSGLQNTIDQFVEDDRREKDMLTSKRDILAKELADLLEVVRLKEQEIALNDDQMHEIDTRISDVASEFHEIQSSIKSKLDDLQAAQSKVESESESLAMKKKEIDDFIYLSEQKRAKLAEIAGVSSDEGNKCKDLVEFQRNLAASILKRRQDRIHFAKLEESILEDVRSLKQQVADARATLQELSSRRGSLEEEIVLVKQRTSYIEKRVPELEAEKKVAAAARNFKEAGRIAAEAKALNAEKEQLHHKQQKASAELDKVEGEMRSTGKRIEECEGLILVKEKEGATTSFKRLRLVAAVARAERAAALQAGDWEEGELLLAEAQAAESKARELNENYHLHHPQLEEEQIEAEQQQSAAFIINSSAQHLAQLASSFTLDPLS